LVPVTNGSIPEAPGGGHSSHAGTLLEGAAVALPDDPPEEDEVDPLLRDELDPAPPVPPPVGEAPDVAAAAAEVARVPFGVVVVAELAVPVPRLTTPLGVTLPGAAAVCAEAGRATAIESSTAQPTAAPARRHSRLFPWNREFSRFCPIKAVLIAETAR
jgi:hypothetical protein